jgi:hypothetical protein
MLPPLYLIPYTLYPYFPAPASLGRLCLIRLSTAVDANRMLIPRSVDSCNFLVTVFYVKEQVQGAIFSLFDSFSLFSQTIRCHIIPTGSFQQVGEILSRVSDSCVTHLSRP